MEQIPKPNWRKTEMLCDQHEVWQEELYYEKMENGLSSPNNALQVEKAIKLSEFRPLEVYKCFERLGWEEALSFRDEEGKNKIPREAIYQWMATLKKDLGSNPPRTTTLTGKVGNKNMVMSFDAIQQVVNFSSKAENLYQYLPEGQIYKQTQGEEASRELLITALMRTQRVLDEDSQYTFKKNGASWCERRCPSLAEDFMEEEEEEDGTEESESEDETETEKATRRLKKSIHEHVVANRPTEYAGWDRPFQMLWDQNAHSNEIQNRGMTKLEENQERHTLLVNGQFRKRLMIVTGMRRREGNMMIGCMVPLPPSEPSGSGSSDAFDFHGTLQDVEDMFKEYFREQVKSHPYDHHYNPNDYQPPHSGTH
ncbi:hypothetical protein L1987_06164 [Smallanthus sonchifolius]|uniref:Uncharacterized protein n=1 Tax=Smallanthus sonchifolius TaxID=185202 RepID=A0ACB9JXJ2_9ASTR|nr:hypothetical protein L1987_06164 [Smallanthus sonchifolius]